MNRSLQEDVKEHAIKLQRACSDTRMWVSRVAKDAPKVAIEEGALLDAARRAENQARKLAASAARRNSVGVFGPSQAGKSYLVSVLGRERGQTLLVDFAGDPRNFIEEINPAGGKESTGLVTRFTAAPGTSDRAHPVELRLLSECDLVKILANSFMSDFDQANRKLGLPDADEIRRIIDSLSGKVGTPAGHLDEIAMLDIADYFESYFRIQYLELKRAGYWQALLNLGHRLGNDDRSTLYSVMWGGVAELTALFKLLLDSLDGLGHVPTCRASINSLLPREQSIIDVDTLNKGLGAKDRDADTIDVVPEQSDGRDDPVRPVPRALLTALVAEVKVVISGHPVPFFEHTDLLDFPGARSREKLIDLPTDPGERVDVIHKMLLRGKIAYLFQRYTEERELSCMLLCIPPGNQEVKDLTALVGEWVRQTHGGATADRAKLPCGLFIVLTKFDEELKTKPGDTLDSMNNRLDIRLEASVNQLFRQEEWLQDWDGAPFRNTFLLRNPGFTLQEIFDYDPDDSSRESGLTSQAQERLRVFKQGMSNSENCRRHFADPVLAWDSAMALNDGGVNRLIAELAKVMKPDLKGRQLAGRLADRARTLERELARFYSAGAAESRRNKDEEINGLRRKLFTAVNEREFPFRRYFQLIGSLMLPETDMRTIFLRTAEMRLDDEPPLPSAESTAETSDDDPWAEDPWDEEAGVATPGPASNQPSKGKVHDRFDRFAEQVLSGWIQLARDLVEDRAALNALRMDAQTVSALTDELVTGAQRLGIADRIAERTRTQLLSATTRFDEIADRAAGIASMLLNDFIFDLDFSRLEEGRRPGFPEPPKQRVRAVFASPPLPDPTQPLALGDSRSPLEQIRFMDWGVALKQLSLDNLTFEDGNQISEAENTALGAILDVIRPAMAIQQS